jgi:hypothetical protein
MQEFRRRNMVHVEYRNQSVTVPGGISIRNKIIDVSFKSKSKDVRAIAESMGGVSVKQVPCGRRGRIFPVVMACVVAFMSVAAAGVVVWAPLPRAHLMVSLVADMAGWIPAAEPGTDPHG